METKGTEFQQTTQKEVNLELVDNLLSCTTKKQADDREWLEWNTTTKAQEHADSIYSRQHEVDKLETEASRDVKGRPVSYWRAMSINALLALLRKGDITAMDYHEDHLSNEDKEQLKYYLLDYAEYLTDNGKFDGEELEMLEDSNAPIQSITEALKLKSEIFDKDFEDKIIQWDELMALLDKNIDIEYVKQRHVGGVMKRFSPYMSLAVATAREQGITNYQAIVEFVIPDEKVEVNHVNPNLGEREIIIRKLHTRQIARIYVDTDTYRKDHEDNPNTAVGQFKQNPDKEKLINLHGGAIEAFRWNVPLEETLPATMIPIKEDALT